MLSDVDICNMGLAYVLSSETIASLDEDGPAGHACNRFFPICRDLLLQRYPWSFAQVTSALALVDVEVVTNWEYTYELPTDCLAVACVVIEGNEYPDGDEAVPFVLRNYNNRRVLCTNQPEAVIRYTARVTDCTIYPPDVCDALAVMIAARICALLGKLEMQPSLLQLAENYMLMAASRDMNQVSFGPEPDGPLMKSRV